MSIELARQITGYYDEKHVYGWIIDVDHLAENADEDESGTTGPSSLEKWPELAARLEAGEGEPFRMLDGDDELYYSGRIILPSNPDQWEDDYEFRPLSDFGTPNAGACDIQYLNAEGLWTSL